MPVSRKQQKPKSSKPKVSSGGPSGQMAGAGSWRVLKANGNVVHVEIEVSGKEWSQSFLLRSDAHHDNPKSDWKMEKKHLDQCRERNAGIIDCGDLFCAMQGKYDKRSNKSDIREEHQHGDYLDRLVSTAADFYQPYADLIVSIGDGNHETSIKDRHETDLNERLCGVLSDRTGRKVVHSGYTGWVVFQFRRGTARQRRVLWYTHGYGGGGPVTQDTIQAQRQRAYIQADIYCSGHTHDSWTQATAFHRINMSGVLERCESLYAKLGTYKDDYTDGHKCWPVQKGIPPKPIGQQWLTFTCVDDQVTATISRAT